MSDLISRSALIQTLKYNKAINEDDAKGKMMVIPVDNVIEYVEKMPTAYNVDKVVEQIKKKGSIHCLNSSCDGDCALCDYGVSVRDIIDLVKEGGVE